MSGPPSALMMTRITPAAAGARITSRARTMTAMDFSALIASGVVSAAAMLAAIYLSVFTSYLLLGL